MKIDSENRKILLALKSAVTEALEKKRRLRHYAVVWQDGRPAIIHNDDKNFICEPSVSYKTED